MRVDVNGSRLHYVDNGHFCKPAIVLIHAFPFSSRMWQSQIHALNGNYRVIAFDLRGQGGSDVGDGQFTLDFLVDDLISLLNHLDIDRAILCGLSMGGYVSLRAVERYTDRVLGLILCDTKSEADSNEGKLGRTAAIRAIKRDGVKSFAKTFLTNAFSPTSLRDQELVNAALKIICRNKPLGLCGMLLALAGRTDTSSFQPKIRVPTLILVGQEDKITPPNLSRRLHVAIHGSDLRTIPRTGHLSSMENPKQFNRYLLKFLEQKFQA